MRKTLSSLGVLVVCGARLAAAQCPDGTPPPCQSSRAPAREIAHAPDPHRIVVLPFRVTTADTLLGEGFAELLAAEFTGEGSPRAVDMATALSAWRHAGGGLRSPLPRAEAVRLARELGAGLVSEGSIVGLGGRVSVTANLLTVPDGTPRGSATRVSGAPDSLDALLRQTATGLLASVGGQQREIQGARFTESPVAMRQYLEGLSAWRRGRLEDASAAFDHAIAEDSAFAQALFRRYLAAGWGTPGIAPYARLAWERRSRLSLQERTVLEGVLGTQYPRVRLAEERLADRQRAVDQVPDSPDALYFLGDFYYHYAAQVDPINHLQLAKQFLGRSAAIDSQATVLRHLIEIGVRTQDTGLLRRVLPAYERTEDAGRWAAGWLVAASTGDQALLAALRRRPVEAVRNAGAGFWIFTTGDFVDAPARLLDEGMERWSASVTQPQVRALMGALWGMTLAVRGRPVAAERVWAGAALGPNAIGLDQIRVRLALADMGTGLAVVQSMERLAAFQGDSETTAANECLSALWRARQGDTAAVDVERFRRFDRGCATALEILRASRLPGAAADAALAEADSTVRMDALGFGGYPFEPVLLARTWEARGNLRRALAAIRLRVFGAGIMEPCCWREEGRLATLAGDTSGAIRAYRTYLIMHQDAEPILVPQRDSVRATLALIERR